MPIAGEDNHSSQLRKPREQTPIAAPYEPSGSGSPVPPENELPLSSRPVNRTDPADVDFENPDGLPNDLAIGSILAGRYDIMSIFGRGHFSTCFEAYDMSDNKRVNIKRFNPRWCGVGESEANMLEHFRNSSRLVNIDTTFWEAAEVGEGFITQSIDTFHIVTEVLYPDATVSLPECACSIDHPSIACPVRHKALAKIMSQVLSGLAELHSRGYIHADLTPSNILSSTGRGNAVKIIDLSNAIPRDERVSYEEDYNVQTACYRSPEMMLGYGPIGKHIDVWSAGVIALELLFGSDIVIPGGIEGAELLRSPVEGRDAIVRRMIDIFGSVKSCEGGKYWLEVYKELGTRWGWDKKQGKIKLDENRGAICDVLAQIENKPLQRFLAGMVNTDYEERSTVDEALRDPWLVSTLLGEWGTVLMNPGWCEDEDVYSEGGRRVRRRISTPRRQVRDFGVQAEIPDSPPLFKPGPNDFETSPTPPMSNEEEDEDDYVDLVR